ncbi:MAG: hypothetical protein MUC38_02585 [Cyclobacteriaceae bacterium]|nr:hypothetical protein [Cyclobacteriaceae bacterium]
METKTAWRTPLFSLWVVIFLSVSGSQTRAQQPASHRKDFNITIEETETGFKMHSVKGSAWINLSFRLSDDKPQGIDEYGMTTRGQATAHTDPQLADYLFLIKKTEEGIELTGIEGTAWKQLKFTLPEKGKRTINAWGIVDQ